MPFASPLRRAMGAALLTMFVALAGPASILAAQPTPGYSPAFVTQREPGGWEDCIWASASMLLDKWTSGTNVVGRERLRRLSGDRQGGSNLGDVKRAFAKLGVGLATSPGGGDSISWSSLVTRLTSGGGAILLGDYGKLPARYGRWDSEFWSRKGTGDDHALYLDRYDRRTGRILVMDPLAPAGWGGEWIPLAALKRFAWRTGGGALWAALTPPARVVPPFEGVAISHASARVDAQGVHVAWQVEAAPSGWAYRGATVSTEVVASAEIDPALPSLQAAGPLGSGGSVASPTVSADQGIIELAVPLPSLPGLYRVSVGLAESTTGRPVAAGGPYSLYVPGALAATVTVPSEVIVAAGGLAKFPVLVTNSGTKSWADPPFVAWLPIEAQQTGDVRLVGRWLPATTAGSALSAASGPFLSASTTAVSDGGPAFEPPPTGKVDLGPLHLETGEQGSVVAQVQAPAQPGTWWLVFEIVDDAGRSLALSGSAPGIVAAEVLPPEAAVPAAN